MDMNTESDINTTSNNRSKIIAISVICIIVALIGLYIWHNHNKTLIAPTTFIQEQDTIDSIIEMPIDTLIVDSVPSDSIDSVSVDSLKSDSIRFDSINKTKRISNERIFDTSKKEMKDKLLSLEETILETTKKFEKGSTSKDKAFEICDSVTTEINKILKDKNSEEFKNQIKAIKRKTDSLINAIGYSTDETSNDNDEQFN